MCMFTQVSVGQGIEGDGHKKTWTEELRYLPQELNPTSH